MNRRGFIRGLITGAAIVPVSTRTIIDMGANTWRNTWRYQHVDLPYQPELRIADGNVGRHVDELAQVIQTLFADHYPRSPGLPFDEVAMVGMIPRDYHSEALA